MLSDVTRLHLLWLLAREESDVGSLAGMPGVADGGETGSDGAVARRLVETRRNGRHVNYRP
ncbi:hypothetical protein ACIBAG_28230 [Streptomyces sp. NPDC051243]|uniref:hypothetical protein n=1 Tax=Streptomyces sp. NPDC051243 TaxID=3365646 RepID=UPI0037BDF424